MLNNTALNVDLSNSDASSGTRSHDFRSKRLTLYHLSGPSTLASKARRFYCNNWSLFYKTLRIGSYPIKTFQRKIELYAEI